MKNSPSRILILSLTFDLSFSWYYILSRYNYDFNMFIQSSYVFYVNKIDVHFDLNTYMKQLIYSIECLFNTCHIPLTYYNKINLRMYNSKLFDWRKTRKIGSEKYLNENKYVLLILDGYLIQFLLHSKIKAYQINTFNVPVWDTYCKILSKHNYWFKNMIH